MWRWLTLLKEGLILIEALFVLHFVWTYADLQAILLDTEILHNKDALTQWISIHMLDFDIWKLWKFWASGLRDENNYRLIAVQ